MNLGDISKIDPKDIPEHNLFTYSFPCQDLSVAGKQAGLGKGTRSGLLYECEKVIEYCKPKYLLLENVKNLVSKKFKPQFDEWLKYLEDLGYTNYWQVLNAKHYGVPQNRERVFVVSILGEHDPYEFPDPIPLDRCIRDILEAEVDEKYYINKPFNLVNKGHQAERDPKILEHKIQQNVKVRKHEVDVEGLKKALKDAKTESGLTIKYISHKLDVNKTTVEHWFRSDECFSIPDEDVWLELKKLLGIITDEFDKSIMEFEIKPNEYDMSNRVYGDQGIAPTLTASGESGAKKIICEVERTPLKFLGRNGKKTDGDYTFCVDTCHTGGIKEHYSDNTFRIRKLTPRECFRLMGMRDDDIDKIQEVGISKTQQYKMAGNSIVVDVLEAIFKNLYL